MRTLVIICLFLACGRPGWAGEPLTVCQALSQLDDLNGKEVSVRGAWGIGDTGEILIALGPCEHRTVRDGWVWQDAIRVFAGAKEAAARSEDYWRLTERMRDSGSLTSSRIVATLSGRLETRRHFEVRNGRPAAFRDFVALLRYLSVQEMQIAPYEAGQLEWELELCRRPVPRRVKRDSR